MASAALKQEVDELREIMTPLGRSGPAHRVIGVPASLYPDPSIVNRATAAGILAMGMSDDTMQVLDPEALA